MNNDTKQNPRNIQTPQRGDLSRMAAASYRREKLNDIYAGHGNVRTPQTTPIPVATTPVQPNRAQTIAQINQNNQILTRNNNNNIKPLSSQNPSTTTPTSGPVDYTPSQHTQQPARTRQNQYSAQNEQWKRYHQAWQNYYQKYYESYYTQAINQQKKIANIQPEVEERLSESEKRTRAIAKIKQNIARKAKESGAKIRKSRHFFPILATTIVVLVFLFLQYNRFIFASVEAYISPGNAEPQQVIQSPSGNIEVGPDSKLIIPKINVDVPILFGVPNDQNSLLKAMDKGVVNFSIPGANSVPGQVGNTVLSGHSSNDLFEAGDYKFIFVQLDKLDKGDVFYINYKGKRYTYSIKEKKVVMPNDVKSLIFPTDKPLVTLLTCTPIGTAEKRLLVIAEQIAPDPTSAQKAPQDPQTNTESSSIMPRNSPTFFERLMTWNWK